MAAKKSVKTHKKIVTTGVRTGVLGPKAFLTVDSRTPKKPAKPRWFKTEQSIADATNALTKVKTAIAQNKAVNAGLKPPVRLQGSINDALFSLQIGQSISRCRRITMTDNADEVLVENVFATLAGIYSAAIAYLKKSDPRYKSVVKVERGMFITNDRHMVLVVAATRIS